MFGKTLRSAIRHRTIYSRRAITAAGVRRRAEAVSERSKMKEEEGDATSAECISAEVHNTHIRELNMGKPPKRESQAGRQKLSLYCIVAVTEPEQ
jgi:hypothetical protein